MTKQLILVPIEPTTEMLSAGEKCSSTISIWRAMIAAAPQTTDDLYAVVAKRIEDGHGLVPGPARIGMSEMLGMPYSPPYPPDGPAAVFENRKVSEDGKMVDIDFTKIEERVLARYYSDTLAKLVDLANGKADCRRDWGEDVLLPDVNPDRDLLGQGEFDSLGIVEFMLTCEDEFKGLTTDAQEDYKVFAGPLKDLATWIIGKLPNGG